MISFDIQMVRSEFRLDAAGEFGAGITAIFGPSGASNRNSDRTICISNEIMTEDHSIA
jgi:ABC-type molybdate transport system ATPase subunit